MVDTSSINLDVSNSGESLKEATTRENRRVGMEKAREALALKRKLEKEGIIVDDVGSKPKAEKTSVNTPVNYWMDVFLVILQNMQLKGSRDVPSAIKVTDDTIQILKEQGKI